MGSPPDNVTPFPGRATPPPSGPSPATLHALDLLLDEEEAALQDWLTDLVERASALRDRLQRQSISAAPDQDRNDRLALEMATVAIIDRMRSVAERRALLAALRRDEVPRDPWPPATF